MKEIYIIIYNYKGIVRPLINFLYRYQYVYIFDEKKPPKKDDL